MLLCYIVDTKRSNRPQGGLTLLLVEIPPRRSVKVLGWFFYVDLLTKRENECKQRHKKYAESQHILEIKAISHRHHLHSIRMKGLPTLQHGCSYI